jgi:hypothetical protein
MRSARTSASEVGGAGIEKDWRWQGPTVPTGRAKIPSVSLLVPYGLKAPEIGKRAEAESSERHPARDLESYPFGGGTHQRIMS